MNMYIDVIKNNSQLDEKSREKERVCTLDLRYNLFIEVKEFFSNILISFTLY